MRKRLIASLVVAGLLVLPACSARDDNGNGATQNDDAPSADGPRASYYGDVSTEPADGERKTQINFGAFQEPTTLDPTRALGTGSSGGNELHAIYDTLLSYNPETLEYGPRLAEDFSFNEDGTELTLNLREGVTFTDGTPLNAEAVIYNLKRHVEMPSRFGSAVGQATRMEAVDEYTVVLGFDAPSFGYLGDLTSLPGAIASPTAIEELGLDAYASQPVGAGPYMLERWSPGEELVLTANPDYWGGKPETETLRFVYLGSGEATADSLDSGSIDIMWTREPIITTRLLESSRGFNEPTSMTQIMFMNMREGNATEDIRVRKALVQAIDPEIINDRAYEGGAIASKSIIPEGAAMHGAPTTLVYDPEAAAALVEEAKADSDWDGTVNLMCDQTTQERDVCQALEGMFNAVGFNTEVEYRRDKANQVWVSRDFEIAVTASAMPDTDLPSVMWNNYGSTSGTNVTGYNNPDLDEAARELRGAQGVEDIQAATAKIQAAFDEDPPVALLATQATTYAWNDNVTGVVPSGAYSVFLDKVVVTEN